MVNEPRDEMTARWHCDGDFSLRRLSMVLFFLLSAANGCKGPAESFTPAVATVIYIH
jgi:hypothetical protein